MSNKHAEFNLERKVILLSGCAGLIGREISRAFVDYGASLIMTDIKPIAELEEQASIFQPSKVLPVSADITVDADIDNALSLALRKFGRIDVLVNLAALDAKFDETNLTQNATRFDKFPLQAWERSLKINCTGLFLVTQKVVRVMLRQGAGNIINVASTYSLVAPNNDLYKLDGENEPRYKPVDYVGTKSMVPNFSRYLATTYGGMGIRCNYIAPHGVDNGHNATFRKNFEKLSPLRRMCRVEELRGPFVFLASDASSYMNGSLLEISGGWTAW